MAETQSVTEKRQPLHGGNIITIAKELGCSTNDLIDMSSNLSPLPPPDELLSYLHEHLGEIAFLPESDNLTISEMFADRYHLDPKQILAGSGTTEFIFALPAVLAPHCAVITNPTYSDYHRACRCASIEVQNMTCTAEENFLLDLNALDHTLKGGELVFICNPNNPTGMTTGSGDLLTLIQKKVDTFFVVDESYLPFCNEQSLLHWPLPNNLFVLQSYSKIFTIPGLRLGFLIGPPEKTALLRQSCRPWGVNRLAQIAGMHLLEHYDKYENRVLQFLEPVRKAFVSGLKKLPNLTVFQGKANFFLCRLEGGIKADMLREALLRHRIIIRNCSNFESLDDRWFRISLKGTEENEYCLGSLKTILGEMKCE